MAEIFEPPKNNGDISKWDGEFDNKDKLVKVKGVKNNASLINKKIKLSKIKKFHKRNHLNNDDGSNLALGVGVGINLVSSYSGGGSDSSSSYSSSSDSSSSFSP